MTSQTFGNSRGFTLLEVLTTLAFLVVVIGLMVSLARFVRAQSAHQYTRRLLADLEAAQLLYGQSAHIPLPADRLYVLNSNSNEIEIRQYVDVVNQQYVTPLMQMLHPGEQQAYIRDAWGNPIGYLPRQDPRIGMAPQNRPFFFSAGPDGRALTRQDNLYSYEQMKSGTLNERSEPLDIANNDPSTTDRRTAPEIPADNSPTTRDR